jgi:hypothetical protein
MTRVRGRVTLGPSLTLGVDMSISERLDKYTVPEPNTGCWLWIGACAADGYPRLTIGSLTDKTKKSVRVNRLVCEMVHGLPEGMHALHKCDNPICVNPDHIYPGTSQQNTYDCIKRMRRTQIKRGSQNVMAVLNEDQVISIRLSSEKGVELAKKYGVSQAAISLIRSRKNWGHI